MHRRNRNRHASKGAVTLGDIVGRVRMLEIACRHCARQGRLRVGKLIAEDGRGSHGAAYLRERLRRRIQFTTPSCKLILLLGPRLYSAFAVFLVRGTACCLQPHPAASRGGVCAFVA
jgi:hypothetical protein